MHAVNVSHRQGPLTRRTDKFFTYHSLGYNDLTDRGKDMTGVTAIAEALKVNKTLQSIEYAAKIQTSFRTGCEPFTPSVPHDGVNNSQHWHVSRPADALICVRSLSRNGLEAWAAKYLSDGLKENKGLTALECAAIRPSIGSEPFTPSAALTM